MTTSDPLPEPTGTHYITDFHYFPTPLFYPEYEGLKLWFPALDAWVLEMLFDRLEQRLGRKYLAVMEIGSFVGGSAAILSRRAGDLLCVDTWAGSGVDGDEMHSLYERTDVYETFLKNIQLFPIPIEHHRRTLNPDSLPGFLAQRSFDLIFIDGGHDLETVRTDINVAKEHIVPGGTICGHDFTEFKGVTEAALDFGLDGACGTVWWKEMP